eukprot:g16686.t1
MSNGGVKRKLAVLDRDAFLEKSKAARMQRCPQGHFIKAMYSSLVDAIITDPELMVLPLDDHAIVRTGPAKADRDSDSDRQSFLIEFNFLSLCIHSFGSSAWPGGMLSLTPVRSPTAAFIGWDCIWIVSSPLPS